MPSLEDNAGDEEHPDLKYVSQSIYVKTKVSLKDVLMLSASPIEYIRQLKRDFENWLRTDLKNNSLCYYFMNIYSKGNMKFSFVIELFEISKNKTFK